MVFLLALFGVTSVLTLSMAGLTRSASWLLAANRAVAKEQAFHLAEAGLDRALKEKLTGAFTRLDITNTLLNAVLYDQAPLSTGTYAVRVEDNDDGDGDTASDTDNRVIIRTSGLSGGTPASLTITVELANGGPPDPFHWTVAAAQIQLKGNAEVGDIANRARIYHGNDGEFTTTASNEVWASEIAFYDPNDLGLAALCGRCSDASIFHPMVTFDLDGPNLPDFGLDLRPYYNEAQAQGHVITSDTTFTNTSLSGVYYVECGVEMEFKDAVTVTGTIVHEGHCGGGPTRSITVASGGSLTIDSASGAQFDRGMAIIGAPHLEFPNSSSITITGFVMAAGSSKIAATGTIMGGVRATLVPPQSPTQPGPDSAPFSYGLGPITLDGGVRVIFSPLPGAPPTCVGCDGGGSEDEQPQVLLWSY